MKKIAITIGDPCGVGPEVIIKALNCLDFAPKNFILIGNRDIFLNISSQIGITLDKNIPFIHIPCNLSKISYGKQSGYSGNFSFEALKIACNLVKEGKVKAIVTAPVSKKAINMAGYCYSGQTEVLYNYLCRQATKHLNSDKSHYNQSIFNEISYCENSKIKAALSIKEKKDIFDDKPEMLFVAKNFRVMLLTRHVRINNVSNNLSIDSIINSILKLRDSLINQFNITNPRLAICGLNPHAGEEGLLGHEETEIMIPALNILRSKFNLNINGPFPADTIWIKSAKMFLENKPQPYDAYIACYHDQGLIPIKLLAIDSTVNMTINLPVVRTSPSHGTAYDIAGKNLANCGSMLEAIKLASNITS